MFEIEDIIILITINGVGILLLLLGIYIKVENIKFQKKGKRVPFKVIDSKKEIQLDINNNEVGELYITTFEINYNGEKITETIRTKHKFKKNIEIEGIYLPTGKINKISVATEGYNFQNNGALWASLIGIWLISVAIHLTFSIALTLNILLLISTVIILIVLSAIMKNKKQVKK